MIDIIVEGTPETPVVKHYYTCGYCGCEFTAEYNDESRKRESGQVLFSCVCPTCTKNVAWQGETYTPENEE